MPSLPSDQLLQLETTCGSLLYELQLIWDEMGETDDERDKMLLQLEQECLEVYRRKVDQANRSRAQLHQAIADYEAELASIYSALGDRPVLKQADRRAGSLKEQLEAIAPQLEEMRRRKEERIKQILDVKTQIQKISNEIAGCTQFNPSAITVDENDLSLRNLEEYQKQLQALQKEKLIEEQIAKTKEEAFSRKDILEKIEKWLAACEEESWLEDYNKDENRYSASRGAHLTLKRAERARAAVSKLPGMVECLIAKTTAWEKERGKPFLYDGIRLLSMLEEYSILRQEKEQERRRQRDQKRLQGQLMTEQEALFGSKPSPAKPHSAKKALGQRTSNSTTNRRLSLGGAMLQPPTLDFLPPKATVPAVSRQGTPQVSKETKRDRLQYNLQNQQEDDYTTLSAGAFTATSTPSSIPMATSTPGSVPIPMSMTPVSMPIPMSTTPGSVTIPMQSTTPIQTPTQVTTLQMSSPLLYNNSTPIQNAVQPQQHHHQQHVEYSFEERRAGFVLLQDMHWNVLKV